MYLERKKRVARNNLFLRWDYLYEGICQTFRAVCPRKLIRAELGQHFESAVKVITDNIPQILAIPAFTSSLKKVYRVFATKEYVQKHTSQLALSKNLSEFL